MPVDKRKEEELTEEERFQLKLQTEAELGRLARTYTILDRSRGDYASGKLAKQRKVLNIFKKEQNDIFTDLAVASAPGRKKEDEKRSRQLRRLLQEYDLFDHEIKTQKSHLTEIDGQIQMTKKKVLELQAQQVSDAKYEERALNGEKTLQTLENKLEVQIKKFCAISSENVRLREEIKHLLIERSHFNKCWDSLINNLSLGKKFMLDLIEQATLAYDQREEWVSKLQFLRSKAHNDLLAHIQEMRELQRKKDNDSKLQEFFRVKGQKRIMKDMEEQEMKRRQKTKKKMQMKLERYLQILITIKDFTGEEVVFQIAKQFLNQEEENFAMFKYVNELHREIELLSDSLGKLQEEIDEQEILHAMRKQQQESKLEKLKAQLEEATKAADEKEEELNNVDKQLKIIFNGIGVLFKLFKCKNDPLVKLLGHNETIHRYNVILYLEILEQNIQEALVTVFYKEKKLLLKKKIKPEQMTIYEEKTPPVIEPIERIAVTNPCPLCVEHEIVSDVIDILQFAYTKSEIQDKLRKRDELRAELGKPEDRLHNVSACHLPKSRQIMQKRYQ